MNIKLKYIISALAVIGLISCEKDAEVDLPRVDPMPVLYCYLSPADTAVNVSVTLSQPLFTGDGTVDYTPDEQAQVSISNGALTVPLVYNANAERFQVSTAIFPIQPGQTYTVNAVTSNGKSASATTTVPLARNYDPQYVLDHYTPGENEWEGGRYFINASWNHYTPGEYYRLVATEHYLIDSTMGSPGGSQGPIFLNVYYNPGTATGRTTTQVEIRGHEGINVEYYMDLVVAGEPYYLFHLSLQNNNNGGDPFSEPSLVYTNVQGGFGCVAGYIQERRVLAL